MEVGQLKFSLKDFALANVSTATETISYARFNNNVLGSDVEAVSTSAARSTGSAFRYDSTAKQYIFNLSTKTLTAGTYKLTITLND